MSEETQNSAAFEAVAEAVQVLCNVIADILNPIIEAAKIAVETFNGVWWDFMREVANPKIYHLAFHAKTQRARKKNRKRLQLEFQRYCKEMQNEK